MISHKIFELLSNLDRKEMTRFREFADSPYHNKHRDVRALTEYLSRIFPQFNERNCRRETIWNAVAPDRPYDFAQLALLFTYTRRLLDDFLMQEQFWRQPDQQNLLLLSELRRRNLFDLYEKKLRQTGSPTPDDGTAALSRYLLAAEADAYFTRAERRRNDESLQQKANLLDAFYLAEKLRDACEMQVRRHILKVDYSSRLLDAVLREVGDNITEYAHDPAIFLYYHIYRMLSRDEESQRYFEALEALRQRQEVFDKTRLSELYNYFQNYCIRRINLGDERFLEEIFKLYLILIEQELLYEDGLLSEWHYKNIITTGIRLRRLPWVRAFIESQKERLPPDARDNAYRFNLAAYHHAAGEYDAVLQLLLQVEYSDVRYSLGAKALLLRTYYELHEWEALDSLVGSMRQYLQRNRLLADFNRNGYHNLFRFTRRAAAIRSQSAYLSDEKYHSELERLRRELSLAGEIFNKSWLMEKVEELAGCEG